MHFGWARVDVSCSSKTYRVHGILSGYAYETVPNKGIRAGQEHGGINDDDLTQQDEIPAGGTVEAATLGRLAQGASGIVAWRKESLELGHQPWISGARL